MNIVTGFPRSLSILSNFLFHFLLSVCLTLSHPPSRVKKTMFIFADLWKSVNGSLKKLKARQVSKKENEQLKLLVRCEQDKLLKLIKKVSQEVPYCTVKKSRLQLLWNNEGLLISLRSLYLTH